MPAGSGSPFVASVSFVSLAGFTLELARLRGEVRGLPADVIDRVAFARRRVAALHEDPDAAVFEAVDSIFELRHLAGVHWRGWRAKAERLPHNIFMPAER